MSKEKFDPEKILGRSVAALDRQSLCEFASKLCSAVKEDAGTGGYRGGIFPSNISLAEDGSLAIGPAAPSAWEGEELSFIAPELYWNGKRSPASDVYSVGMVLYYAANGAKLPFEGECEDPLVRRMNGAEPSAPRGAGKRMGEIIAKAVRFQAEDRYQSMDELKTVLDSCVANLLSPGTDAAQAVFGKGAEELSDIEKMMLDIMGQGEINRDAPELPKAVPETPAQLSEPAAESKAAEASEDVRVYEPAAQKKREVKRVIELKEDKNPEIAPISFSPAVPAVKYTKNLERERKIKEEVRRRKARPVIIIGLLCAILIAAALILSGMSGKLRSADIVFGTPEPEPIRTVPTPIVIPTPDPTVVNTPAPTDENPIPDTPKEHVYQIFVEDVSWTEAQQRCESMGGHLVTISDVDELQKVTELAEDEGVTRVWVGCHRVSGEMEWVTGEEITYYPWAQGEPSFIDVNDEVDEDYVLLWNHNGWCYNDSRNDPVSDYPEMYSGRLAYVCETE